MDFDLTPQEQAFADEVEKWLVENHDPVVMDPTRENFAQLADTPERRAFMKKLAAKGWLGMTWPKEYGGQEIEGIYEFILNEALSRVGAPQIGKGVGIIGKTLIRHGSEKLKREFLPKILAGEIDFALGYSEPQAGSDAANMQLKAEKVDGRLEAQRPEDLDDVGPLRGLVLGGRAHRPGQAQARRHLAVPDPDESPRARDPEHADDRQGHHQPGVLHRRVRARRLPRRRARAAASSTSPRRSISSASRCTRCRRPPSAPGS